MSISIVTLKLCWLLLVYFGASVPVGVVVSSLWGFGPDPRDAGSKNIGATNILRTQGPKLALLTLVLDMGKGFLAVGGGLLLATEPNWLGLCGGVAFLGHCFPIYLAFRGGKGVATGAGAMAVIAPWPTLCAALVWGVVFGLGRTSSVASLLAAVTLLGSVLWWEPGFGVMTACLVLGVICTHHANVRRLMAGQELSAASAAIVHPSQRESS